MKKALFISITLLLAFGCGNSKNPNSEQTGQNGRVNVVTPKFTHPTVPAMITDPNLQFEYFVKHYWDHFDFADTTYVPTPEITEQAWVDYINYLYRFPLDKAQEEMKAMMLKSSQNSKKLFLYFMEMADKYLYDPNSPTRSEELYIAVLEVMIQTPALDDAEKILPQYRLDWAYKNRMETKATDFQYTQITGQTGTLYQLRAEYVLLFFNNPGCTSCQEHIAGIRNSAFMSKLSSEGRFKVLSIYPDEDLDEWKKHYTNYPAGWTNGYDASFTIKTKYDLKATPTLYLLDKDKMVILKDASLAQIENYFAYVNP